VNPLNALLKYDNNGLHLTSSFEGCDLNAYRDQRGILTIGYGHTGPDVHLGLTITKEHALALLASDVTWAETVVKNYVTVVLTQAEFDSLVDLAFNIGSGHFANSTVLRDLNAGNKRGAHDAFMMWDKTNGETNKGLARRRQTEEDLFATGVLNA
jgi:lysozyme